MNAEVERLGELALIVVRNPPVLCAATLARYILTTTFPLDRPVAR
jgi:hypothetical protein